MTRRGKDESGTIRYDTVGRKVRLSAAIIMEMFIYFQQANLAGALGPSWLAWSELGLDVAVQIIRLELLRTWQPLLDPSELVVESSWIHV